MIYFLKLRPFVLWHITYRIWSLLFLSVYPAGRLHHDDDGWVDLELEIDEEIELLVSADGGDPECMQLKLDLEEIFDEYFTISENFSFHDSVRHVLHTLFNPLLKAV